ncbi:hypothetical protein GCM10027594_32810 [Hymenobacter agri]
MGPQLREMVEQLLLRDLRHYGIDPTGLRFDWSDACVEGHGTTHLDGRVENYSGIALFVPAGSIRVEGWMEFIHSENFFLAYWETLFECTLDLYEGPGSRALKVKLGIPPHVWEQIPLALRPRFESDRM